MFNFGSKKWESSEAGNGPVFYGLRTLYGFYPDLDVALHETLTPKQTKGGGELIQDRSRHQGNSAKSNENLAIQTLKAFASLKNALNADGRILFVFAASLLEAWGIIADAIQENQLAISAAWPIITEDAKRPRSRNSRTLSVSIWLCLCHRKKSQTTSLASALEAFRVQLPQIQRNIKEWALPYADQRCYLSAMAMSAFSRWARILDSKGRQIHGFEFLKEATSSMDAAD